MSTTNSISQNLAAGEIPLVRPPYYRERLQTVPQGDSLTHRSHADTVNINRIMARYMATGRLPEGNDMQYVDATPFSGDLTEQYERSESTLSAAAEALNKPKRKSKQEPATAGPDQPEGEPAPAGEGE